MDKKIFEFGDLKERYDVSDYIVAERTDCAFRTLADSAKDVEKETTPIGKIKKMFHAYAALLDTIFDDENATNKALGGTSSLDDIMSCVFAFIDFVKAQDSEMSARWIKISQKYAPRKK